METASFIFNILNAIFTLSIALIALRFAATPRINIDFEGEAATGRREFRPGESASLRFALTNRGQCIAGFCYARPAVRNLKVFMNFESRFEPRRLRFGSILERSTLTVYRGGSHSKYLVADGIYLFYGELGEDIEVDVKMPAHLGKHEIWIASLSDTGDHGVQRFSVRVV